MPPNYTILAPKNFKYGIFHVKLKQNISITLLSSSFFRAIATPPAMMIQAICIYKLFANFFSVAGWTASARVFSNVCVPNICAPSFLRLIAHFYCPHQSTLIRVERIKKYMCVGWAWAYANNHVATKCLMIKFTANTWTSCVRCRAYAGWKIDPSCRPEHDIQP